MNLKKSMFNYVFENGEDIYLHNTYTKVIAKSKKKDIIKRILEDPCIIHETDLHLLEKMKEDGFIVNDRLDEFALSNLRHFDMITRNALSLTIMPTMQCNFDCSYCFVTTDDPLMSSQDQDNLIKYIKKNIKKYDSLKVEWFGGEPLLAVKVINNLSEKMIKICKDTYKPYSAFMTTNGYNLSLDVFKQMLSNKVTGYQITLDGPALFHDKTRALKTGKPTFDHILTNLKNIQDNVRTSSFTIIIRTNLTRELILEIDDYLEFMYKEFGQDNRFTFYFSPVGDWGGERVKTMTGSLPDGLELLYDKLISSPYKLNYQAFHRLLCDGMCIVAQRNSLAIGSGGRVYKCSMILDNEKNWIGSIDSKGTLSLDEEKMAQWVYRFDSLKGKCHSCAFRPRCNNSLCPASGYIRPKHDRCDFDRTNIDKIILLITNGVFKGNSRIIKEYE